MTKLPRLGPEGRDCQKSSRSSFLELPATVACRWSMSLLTRQLTRRGSDVGIGRWSTFTRDVDRCKKAATQDSRVSRPVDWW